MAIVSINGNDYRTDEDGITHLNVYSRSKTALGRWLSNFERTPLILDEGNFESLEAYYHYLKIMQSLNMTDSKLANEVSSAPWFITTIGRLRLSYGKHAQTIGRQIKRRLNRYGVVIQNRPTEEFIEQFEEALTLKLNNNPTRAEELRLYLEDGIPIVHYYILPDGEAYYLNRFDWLCDRIRTVV